MTEFVPLALACGHVVQGMAHFDVEPGVRPARVECQEGCGWQEFVYEYQAHMPNPPKDVAQHEEEYDEHSIIEYDGDDEPSQEQNSQPSTTKDEA